MQNLSDTLKDLFQRLTTGERLLFQKFNNSIVTSTNEKKSFKFDDDVDIDVQ